MSATQMSSATASHNTTNGVMQKKRVLVFASQLLPWSETFIREQVLAMQEWHPILVGERYAQNGLSLDGIEFHLLRPPQKERLRCCVHTLCRLLRLPNPTSVRRLESLGASLIHAHFGTVAVDAWPIARALDLPMLVTLHGFDINIYREWWESGGGGWQRRRYPKQLLRLAQEKKVSFIAVSDAIRKRAIEYGIPSNKVSVRHIGIDTEKFRPSGLPISLRSKRVLFVGRLIEKKGVEYLIRAFAEVRAALNEAELVIVGDGPLNDELRRLASSLNVEVNFQGILTDAQVRQEISQARVLCVPSIRSVNGDTEGLPTVIIEALSCGVPVITSAPGSNEVVVDSINGHLFPSKDCSALASCIMSSLTDEKVSTDQSINSRRSVVENFSIINCTRLLQDTYSKVITDEY